MIDRFDAVIAGGGPAGMAAALELVREPRLAVAVIEPRPGRLRLGETLPPGARPLLVRLGVLTAFLASGHARCEGTMAAWGSADVHVTDYLLHPERHGWRLDREAFDRTLAAEALQRGVVLIEGVVGEAEYEHDRWRVTIDGGERAEIAARVLVDATGRGAVLARRLGACKIAVDQLAGFAGVFEPHAAIERAYPLIEARRDGWIYSSVTPDGALVVVAMTDSDLGHALRLHDRQAWTTWLAESAQTAACLDGARLLSGPIVASAASHRLDRAAGNRWLAAGDAAAAFDPLSSQGIASALRSGIDAAAAVRTLLAGDPAALDAYAGTVEPEYASYLETRARYYAMERRWPNAPFWARRAG